MRHPIHGQVSPQFRDVYSTFEDNFNLRGEIGASVCVWHKGRKVIDLWGGFADLEAHRPWTADSLTTIFSCTKGLVALCFLILVDRGVCDYDAPIVEYWPSFARADDPRAASITLRTLLNHRAGLVGIQDPLSLEEISDIEALRGRLEREPFAWTPNTDQGYHGVSFGLLTRVLFQQITGESIGTFLHREVTEPLKVDVFLGLPPNRHEDRLAPIFPNSPRDLLWGVLPRVFFSNNTEGRFFRGALNSKSDTALAFGQPEALGARGLKRFNAAEVRALELPWANAQASARGLATLYRAMLTSGRLFAPEQLSALKERQSWTERDRVLRKPLGFSQGFIKEETHLFSPNIESFGHPGAGGALGWVDPKEELAIGYVMNRMGYQVRSPRALALCHSIYRSLGYSIP